MKNYLKTTNQISTAVTLESINFFCNGFIEVLTETSEYCYTALTTNKEKLLFISKKHGCYFPVSKMFQDCSCLQAKRRRAILWFGVKAWCVRLFILCRVLTVWSAISSRFAFYEVCGLRAVAVRWRSEYVRTFLDGLVWKNFIHCV